MRKIIERQLKGVPKEEQERMISLITKNPEFFQKIAVEIKAKMESTGKDQMAATMEVMKTHEEELKKINQ